MTEHKFKTGQAVELHARKGAWIPVGPFTVVRALPLDGGELRYRLKSQRDGHEFVASESDLSRV